MPSNMRPSFMSCLRFSRTFLPSRRMTPRTAVSAVAEFEDGNWWVKLSIDIGHALAWSVVQEFGYVLNFLSLDEPLPTVFKPVSPAPYMNGGPAEFLSWVIECTDQEFSPSLAAQWLRARLPDPLDDLTAWPANQS